MFTKLFLLTVLLGVAGLSVAHAQGPMAPRLPAPLPQKIAHVTVAGNVHVPTADILVRLNQKRTTPPDADSTEAQRLVNVAAVQDMGLFQSVTVTGAPDPAGGTDITCMVVENPIVQSIKITANTPDGKPTVPAAALIARMHVAVGHVLNTKTLVVDINDLFNPKTGFMRVQGYVCAVSSDINIDPNTGVLTIPLIEAFIDTVKIEGNSSIPAANLLTALGVKPGDVFDTNAAQQGLKRLAHMHQFADIGPFHYTATQVGKVALTVPVRLPRPPFGTFAAAPQKSEAIDYGGAVGASVIVPVRINDRRTGHFLLATNTDLSEISTPFAASLGLTPQAMLVGGQPYFLNGQEAASVALDRMTLGDASEVDIRDLSLPLVDLAYLSKQAGQTIDGVLGADMLSRMTVGIDFPRRRVTFWNHGYLSDAERSAAGFGDGIAMPVTPAFGTFPMLTVDAQIQNGSRTKAASMIVATGNQASVLPAADFESLGIKPIPHEGNSQAVVGRAARLRFGGLSVGAFLFQRDDVNDSTTLGLNVLERYRMLLDGPARTAYFAPEIMVAGSDPRRASSSVPFQFNHLTTPNPVIQVSINGRPPLPFLFDTGTNYALTIDTKAAHTLGLTLDPEKGGVFNGTIPVQTAPVTTAVLQGRTPADNVTVSLEQAMVLDLSATYDGIIEPHIAGIIGSGMLQNMAVRFNFGSRLLTFSPVPDLSSEQADAPPVPGTTVLPLTEGTSDGLYFAAFTPASGPSVPLLIDSGSEQTDLPYAMRGVLHPVKSAITSSWTLSTMGLGQQVNLSRSPYAEIPAGDLSFPIASPGVTFPPLTLGVDNLSRVVATLDIPHMQLTLTPTPKPVPAVYAGWTGVRLTRDKSGFRITRTLPASPAARAGLKAGDVLLSVDGRPLQGQSLFSARTLIDGLAGTPAAFVIRRGNGPPQTVRFRRADVSGDPPSPLNGVYGQRAGANPFKVEAIVHGCPADHAGLVAGDAITAINGQATARLTDAQWETLLLLTRLTLTVTHDGVSRAVILTDPVP